MQLVKPVPLSVLTPSGLLSQKDQRFPTQVIVQGHQQEYKPRLQVMGNQNYFMQIQKDKDTPG